MRHNIKCITISAMLSALSIVIMAIGSFVDVLDLSLSAIASLFIFFAVIEFGKGYATATFLVTSILSFLLLPQKSPAILYFFLVGYYPILKSIIEQKMLRRFQWVAKIVLLHLEMIVCYFAFYLFLPSGIEDLLWNVETLILYFFAIFCFVLFDIALTRFIPFYQTKIRPKLKLK